MLRHIIILALCAIPLAALETPLTLYANQGNRAVVIDPAYGSISIYEVTQSSSNRMSSPRKAQANFIADIDLRLKSYLDERDGVPFHALRVGQDTKPTYGETFTDLMSDKPTAAETRAGKPALRWRALRAENAFWKGEVAYDGVVRAALTNSGQNLLIAVPALHALLHYRIDGDSVTLLSTRNFGPELFITGLNTSPSPAELLRGVPKEKEAEARKALGMEEDAKAGKDAAPAPAADPKLAADEPPTPKSELWVGPSNQESFLVVDTANARALLYRADGKGLQLASVRDLAVDLVVPGLVGGSLRSEPSGDHLLQAFFKERKPYILEFGLPTTKEEVLLLVGQRQAKGKPSPFEAISTTGGLALLNFVDRRVFLTLDGKGAAQINLAAARDYTLDIAVALLDQEIIDRTNAKTLLGNAKVLASENKRKAALLTLAQALKLDPRLHKDAETRLKNLFRDPEDVAKYQALLDEAAKQAEELAKQAEERKKAMEEARQKAK